MSSWIWLFFHIFRWKQGRDPLHCSKNEHFVKELKATLQEKFFNFILPEVICRKMDDKLDHDRSLYCVCRRPKFGHMIFCENETCKTKCYHYTCLDIARHPKGPWFCNDCKKMKLI